MPSYELFNYLATNTLPQVLNATRPNLTNPSFQSQAPSLKPRIDVTAAAAPPPPRPCLIPASRPGARFVLLYFSAHHTEFSSSATLCGCPHSPSVSLTGSFHRRSRPSDAGRCGSRPWNGYAVILVFERAVRGSIAGVVHWCSSLAGAWPLLLPGDDDCMHADGIAVFHHHLGFMLGALRCCYTRATDQLSRDSVRREEEAASARASIFCPPHPPCEIAFA